MPARTPAELAEQAIAAAEGREAQPDAAEVAQTAELKAEAEAAGVTVEQLKGAQLSGMSPQDYALWDRAGGVSVTEIDSIEAERVARREAEHRRLVEKVKAKLP
jgi:hypothetical protein